jgi:hypothetical protein
MTRTTAFSAPAGFPSRPVNSQCKLDHLTDTEKRRFLDVKPETLQESMLFRLNKLAGVCDERVSQLKMVRKLGQGSFGLVLLCRGMFKGREIGVAVKELQAGSIGSQSHQEVDDEAKLALRMSRLGAGPTVYDLFHASLPTKKGTATFQYVFMEPFDFSVGDALQKTTVFGVPRKKFIAAVVPAMLAALGRHLEAGVTCYDVKPGNFVVRQAPGKGGQLKVDVKMIDFGFPHCDIKGEKDCSRTRCSGLDKPRQVVFVLLAAQTLFMVREEVSRAQAYDVMKAAEKDTIWRRRAGLAGAAMAELERNKMLLETYTWYKTGSQETPTEDSIARTQLQMLDDLWLEKDEEEKAFEDYHDEKDGRTMSSTKAESNRKTASSRKTASTRRRSSTGLLSRFMTFGTR